MSYSDPPPPQQPPYGGGQPPQYGGGQPAYGGAAAAGNNKKAIWSLVLGILGICCFGFLTGIPAIILSRQAKNEIAANGQGGNGLATAGLVLGILAVIWGVIGIILWATGAVDFNGSFETS